MDDELIGLLTSLICILDLLWDSSKDQIGIWSLISDIIQEMLFLLEKNQQRVVGFLHNKGREGGQAKYFQRFG